MTITIPRKTSTETKRELGVRRLEVVVRTLATAGELTAATIFHLCHQMPICRSWFDPKFLRPSKSSPGCQQIATNESRIMVGCDGFSGGGVEKRCHTGGLRGCFFGPGTSANGIGRVRHQRSNLLPEILSVAAMLRHSVPPGQYAPCCVVNHTCLDASGRNRAQLTFELIHLMSVKCLNCEIIAAPCTEIW